MEGEYKLVRNKKHTMNSGGPAKGETKSKYEDAFAAKSVVTTDVVVVFCLSPGRPIVQAAPDTTNEVHQQDLWVKDLYSKRFVQPSTLNPKPGIVLTLEDYVLVSFSNHEKWPFDM